MPNWCQNTITISGDTEKMKPIFDFFNPQFLLEGAISPFNKTFVMSTLVPEDEEFERIKESGEFLLTPYVDFYGSKWDFRLSDAEISECTPESITISPNTAWSPVEPFCQRLSKKYGVNVDIMYFESGSDFAGCTRYENGEITNDEDYGYDEGMYLLDNEGFWYEVENHVTDKFEENPDFTLEELLSEYKFITDEDDKNSLIDIYNEEKENYE